jgi:hypothetical protein
MFLATHKSSEQTKHLQSQPEVRGYRGGVRFERPAELAPEPRASVFGRKALCTRGEDALFAFENQ